MYSTLPSTAQPTVLVAPIAPSPLLQLRRTLAADTLKLRRTAALRLALLSGTFPVLIAFLAFFLKGEALVQFGHSAWPRFITLAWQTAGTLLLPLFVILLTSMVVHVETKATGWKHLYAQPVGRKVIFGSKLLVLLALSAAALLVFVGLLLGAGVLLGWLFPKLGFQQYPIPLLDVSWMLVRTYVAMLGILALQYGVSMAWRSFVVPLGVGMGALVATLALGSWEHIDKTPYITTLATTLSMKAPKTGGLQVAHELATHEWYSLAWFAGAVVVGYVYLRWRPAA